MQIANVLSYAQPIIARQNALAMQQQDNASPLGDPISAAGSPSSGGSDWANAIAHNESGGNYQIIGPDTGKGKAYGKYQVMDYNIGPWTKQYLGREMTPEEFLANPQAQDAVFQGKFGSYVQQYGNPQDAASAWFTGRPLAQGANAKDVTGTTGAQYVTNFTNALR